MVPRPGKSTPALTQRKTSKSAINKFSEIAAKEEETTQRVIELKRTKLKASTDREIAKVKLKDSQQFPYGFLTRNSESELFARTELELS